MTQETAIAIAVINITSIAIVAWLLLHVQANLNKYWSNVAGMRLVSARIGVGEVILGLVGAAAWADTLASLLSSSYRTGL